MKKRILGLLTVLCMLTALMPCVNATEIVASGTCGADGDNLTWTLDDEGTLTISGEGEMWYFLSEKSWEDYASDIKTVIIENGVTSIVKCAFMNCKNLTTVSMTDSVTTINGSAFYGCTNLISVDMSENITDIHMGAFQDCVNLKDIEIPVSLTWVGQWAFKGCGSLTKIKIPENCYINVQAFIDCTGLYDIEIPDSAYIETGVFVNTAYYNDENNWENGVLYINNHLFRANAETIGSEYSVKNGTKTITMNAFNNLTLKSIYIPKSMNSIHDGAFYWSVVSDVYYEGTAEEWSTVNHDDSLDNAIIHFNAIGTAPPTITYASFSISAAAPQINVNLADTEYDSTMITAFYKDGALVDMQKTLVSANDVEKTVPVTDTDADTAKVMIWSSIDSMKPLCEAKTIDLTDTQ